MFGRPKGQLTLRAAFTVIGCHVTVERLGKQDAQEKSLMDRLRDSRARGKGGLGVRFYHGVRSAVPTTTAAVAGTVERTSCHEWRGRGRLCHPESFDFLNSRPDSIQGLSRREKRENRKDLHALRA
jgi:hypothetical protein